MSYYVSLTFKCHYTAVVLDRPQAVAREDCMKQGLSALLSCCLSRCFPGIGSLDFPEFWHGDRDLYEFEHDRAGVFGKNLFCSKNWGKWAKSRP